jgi:capsular polysaccharide biosynthesis protein
MKERYRIGRAVFIRNDEETPQKPTLKEIQKNSMTTKQLRKLLNSNIVLNQVVTKHGLKHGAMTRWAVFKARAKIALLAFMKRFA